MTQQPYYPPPQPQGYPQQPYYPPTQPAYQPPVQQPFQQQPQPGYGAPQGMPQGYAAPPQQEAAVGSLADYYTQPSTSDGAAISWKNKPNGTTYAGVVSRDVTNGDVIHDSDPQTKQLKFYNDGRPQFVLKLPLSQVQTNLQTPVPEFPDGEASLYVRGQMRDELTRALAEVGLDPQYGPKAGDRVEVTLVERKQGKGAIPKNVFRIRYTPANAPQAQQQAQQQAPAPQPVAQQPQVQVQQQQQTWGNPQGQFQPAQQPQAQPAAPQGPPQQWAQPQPIQAGDVQPQMAPQGPATASANGLQLPPGMTPEQAAALAQIGALGAPGQQPQG